MKETSIEMNSTGSGTCCSFQIARVGLLQQADARIGTQTRIDLAVTGIDGEHAGGAVLQHAVGKAAGGGAHIHADGLLQSDAPMSERGLQFEPAATDVARIAAEQAEFAILGHRVTRTSEPSARPPARVQPESWPAPARAWGQGHAPPEECQSAFSPMLLFPGAPFHFRTPVRLTHRWLCKAEASQSLQYGGSLILIFSLDFPHIC